MSAVRWLLRALAAGAVAISIAAPATVARADPSAAELKTSIADKQAQIDQVVENGNQIANQLKTTDEQIAQLTEQMAPLQAKLDAAAAKIGEIVTVAYQGRGPTTITAIATSDSPQDFLDGLSFLNYIGDNNQRSINAYTAAKHDYDARMAELQALRAQQGEQKSQHDAQRAQYEKELTDLKALYTKLYGSSTPPSSPSGGQAPPANAGPVVTYVYAQLGTCYDYGGVGSPCFDCSGLSMMAWKQAGVSMPHSAAQQFYKYPDNGLSTATIEPGDLVFYSGLGHVAVYVGDGMVIHASTYGVGVVKSSISMMSVSGIRRPR